MIHGKKILPLNPKVVFTLSVVIGLLPWGIQMIGVSVNLWLGTAVCAVAFFLGAYAFWVWEGASSWHTVLRIGTIVLFAFAYFALIGYQIRSQYRKEHLPAVVVASTTELSS